MEKTFNNLKSQLSEQDIDQLVDLLGHRCRIEKRNRIRSILTYGTSTVPNYGILDRLVKENDQWRYIAGQSYTDEIRTVRECILGK